MRGFFGLWKDRPTDALVLQEALRQEWSHHSCLLNTYSPWRFRTFFIPMPFDG